MRASAGGCALQERRACHPGDATVPRVARDFSASAERHPGRRRPPAARSQQRGVTGDVTVFRSARAPALACAILEDQKGHPDAGPRLGRGGDGFRPRGRPRGEDLLEPRRQLAAEVHRTDTAGWLGAPGRIVDAEVGEHAWGSRWLPPLDGPSMAKRLTEEVRRRASRSRTGVRRREALLFGDHPEISCGAPLAHAADHDAPSLHRGHPLTGPRVGLW